MAPLLPPTVAVVCRTHDDVTTPRIVVTLALTAEGPSVLDTCRATCTVTAHSHNKQSQHTVTANSHRKQSQHTVTARSHSPQPQHSTCGAMRTLA